MTNDRNKSNQPLRMAAFMRYGSLAASTRQRLLQYLPALAAAGIDVEIHTLLGNDYVRRLADPGINKKIRSAWQLLRRLYSIISLNKFDIIWIHYELFPYLPGSLERLAFRSGAPVVLDFDDAFFHAYDDHRHWLVRRLLGHKLQGLMRGAAVCFCGNEYLQAYARRFNRNAVIVPTVLDTDIYVPAVGRDEKGPPVIGWIGSPSTFPYLQPILGLLEDLSRRGIARVRLVGTGGDQRLFPAFELVPWDEQGEVAAIQDFDIGIMPVPDSPFARGKCGYKLIQYMACGLPTVASPIGVNRDIVTHGEDGFLASGEGEWREALDTLIATPERRRDFGVKGRRKVIERYSLASQIPRIVDMLRRIAGHQSIQ